MNGSRFISALLLVWVAFGVALPASAADAPICWCSINGDCKNASTLDQPAPTLATEKDCQNYCVKKGGRALNFDPQNYGTRTGPYCQLPDGEPVFCWCLGPTACENHAFYNDDGKTRFTCDNSGQPPSCAAFCASKGKGWQAIHCDANYVDETAYDDVCAKANGEAGLVRKTIKATPPETIPIAISINGATSVKDISDYIALAYKYSIGVAVILAIIMVIYGGFRYLLGSAAGSVEAGKKINFDAIMGMIIVLGAWLILHTVNPNTLTLRPPSLAIIQGLDIQTTINKVCHSDNDCGKSDNVACLLFDQSQGTCTDGSEGSMCSCRAGGCQRVKWATAVQLGFFRMGGWNSYSNSKDDPNDCTGGQCNHNGAGFFSCQSGLTCAMDWTDGEGTPRCQKVLEVKNAKKNDTVICKTDEDCVNNKGAGFACMMVNREAGFCSDGSEGSRCQCNANDLGCGFLIGILNTNNRGKGYVPCKAGLTCMVSNPQYLSRDAGSIVYGDWYCEKSAQ